MKRPPKKLNDMVDMVLAFRPKAKTAKAKKRVKRAMKVRGENG